MIPICTQCDESFLPGLKALHNSYLRHSRKGFSFHAFLTGSQEFADHVQHDLGIDVMLDVPFPAERYPTSKAYPVARPIMYKNIMMPHLFAEHEKSVYIDTDSIILQNLQPLVDMDYGDAVLAATRCNSKRDTNYSPCESDGYGPMTSLMIFNHGPYRQQRVLDRFVEAMQREDMTWHTIGQGVLHYVVQDEWFELPWNCQAHAGHKTFFEAPRDEIYTLHFMGTKPWNEFAKGIPITERKLKTRAIWREYAGES